MKRIIRNLEKTKLTSPPLLSNENNNQPDPTETKQALREILSPFMRLKDIPKHYLIPDQRMIPEESIRLFYLDQAWMKSMILGISSVAALNEYDKESLKKTNAEFWGSAREDWNGKLPAGVIVHSRLVSHFKNLKIEGTMKGTATNPKVINEVKVNNLLFVLFDQKPDLIKVSTPTHLAHVAFESKGNTLRLPRWVNNDVINIPHQNGIVDVITLFDSMLESAKKEIGSADFARFTMTKGSSVEIIWET